MPHDASNPPTRRVLWVMRVNETISRSVGPLLQTIRAATGTRLRDAGKATEHVFPAIGGRRRHDLAGMTVKVSIGARSGERVRVRPQ